jgi:hypothetical protein
MLDPKSVKKYKEDRNPFYLVICYSSCPDYLSIYFKLKAKNKSQKQVVERLLVIFPALTSRFNPRFIEIINQHSTD